MAELLDRRAVLGVLGVLAVPVTSRAQTSRKLYRIGVLSPVYVPSYMAPFIEGLGELGWAEGRDFVLEYRFTGDRPDGPDAAARELASLRLDAIVTLVTGSAIAARRATADTPIVMMNSGYPVEVGLAKSYGRPGGNVTGNTAFAGTEVFGKHVEILKTLLPRMRRLTVLWGYVAPFVHPREGELALGELKQAAQSLGVKVRVLNTRHMDGVESALKSVPTAPTDALYVSGGSVHAKAAPRIVEFAEARRLPTMTDVRAVFDAGMLLTYAPNPAVLARQAARFVDRILKGARAGELPIERPSRIELVINVKTARALGLTVPPALLHRADQVIDQ